ncbi:hypothetical protein BC831DRAFT_151712 [Entophlyctis helioformis]|nr:hypothetical protein BC831DRAFT_151712 [Entophlyctis helioformis]
MTSSVDGLGPLSLGADNAQPAAARTAKATILLEPLNDTFQTKVIVLTPDEPVKIGRKVSAKAIPETSNGIFDAKVLSRIHAELTLDHNKVMIKDLKSSNGTFINGNRLSEEGVMSAPNELRNGDRLDFGVDIFDEDTQVVLYKRVACKVSIHFGADTIMRSTASAMASAVSAASGNGSGVGHDLFQTLNMDQRARHTSIAEVNALLDEELKVSSDAANMLSEIRSTFESLENQLVLPPSAKANKRLPPTPLVTPSSTAPVSSAASVTDTSPTPMQSGPPSKAQSPKAQASPVLQQHDFAPDINRLTAGIKDANDAVQSLRQDMDKHGTRIKDVEASVQAATAIAKEAQSASAAIATTQATIAASAAAETGRNSQTLREIADLRTTITALTTRLSALEAQAATQIRESTDARTKLSNEIRDVSSRHALRLDSLDKQYAHLRDSAKVQETENERVHTQMSSIKTDVSKAAAEHVRRGEVIEGLGDAVVSVKGTLAQVRSDLDAVRKIAVAAQSAATSSSASVAATVEPATPSKNRKRRGKTGSDLASLARSSSTESLADSFVESAATTPAASPIADASVDSTALPPVQASPVQTYIIAVLLGITTAACCIAGYVVVAYNGALAQGGSSSHTDL